MTIHDRIAAGADEITAYNYAEFVGDDKFLDFRTILPVGSRARDFTTIHLETGESAPLSNFWRERDLLIEFGSLT